MQDAQLDPAEALALAEGARRRTAVRGQAPWYHLVYGLGLTVMTAGLVLPSPIIGTTVGLMIVVANFLTWSRRTGLGPIRHTRRTLLVVIPFAVLIMSAFIAAFVLRERFGLAWAPLAAAPIVGALGALASWRVDRAWLADAASPGA